jgi:hypothetical protein
VKETPKSERNRERNAEKDQQNTEREKNKLKKLNFW